MIMGASAIVRSHSVPNGVERTPSVFASPMRRGLEPQCFLGAAACMAATCFAYSSGAVLINSMRCAHPSNAELVVVCLCVRVLSNCVQMPTFVLH